MLSFNIYNSSVYGILYSADFAKHAKRKHRHAVVSEKRLGKCKLLSVYHYIVLAFGEIHFLVAVNKI